MCIKFVVYVHVFGDYIMYMYIYMGQLWKKSCLGCCLLCCFVVVALIMYMYMYSCMCIYMYMYRTVPVSNHVHVYVRMRARYVCTH